MPEVRSALRNDFALAQTLGRGEKRDCRGCRVRRRKLHDMRRQIALHLLHVYQRVSNGNGEDEETNQANNRNDADGMSLAVRDWH